MCAQWKFRNFFGFWRRQQPAKKVEGWEMRMIRKEYSEIKIWPKTDLAKFWAKVLTRTRLCTATLCTRRPWDRWAVAEKYRNWDSCSSSQPWDHQILAFCYDFSLLWLTREWRRGSLLINNQKMKPTQKLQPKTTKSCSCFQLFAPNYTLSPFYPTKIDTTRIFFSKRVLPIHSLSTRGNAHISHFFVLFIFPTSFTVRAGISWANTREVPNKCRSDLSSPHISPFPARITPLSRSFHRRSVPRSPCMVCKIGIITNSEA